MPAYDVNVIYIKVVKHGDVDLIGKNNFQIYLIRLWKIINKTFHYRKCILIYEKCIQTFFNWML